MELVKLRRKETENKTQQHTIVAVKLNKNQLTEESAKEVLDKRYDEPITGVEFVFIGDLNRYYDYKDMVRKLPKTFQGKPMYRNYCVSYERQMQTSLFVNVCEDVDTSWNTVKSALGAINNKSECYGALAVVSYINK